MTLGEWVRQACEDNAQVPEDVDLRLREHAATNGTETLANLVWQSGEGGVVASKRLRCRPDGDPMGATDSAQMEALGIVGTEAGKLLQQQRHHEVMMRGWWEQFRLLSQQQSQLVLSLSAQLTESHRATHLAHLELDKLRSLQRRELDEYAVRLRRSADNDNAAADPEKQARAKFIEQATGAVIESLPTVIEILADRFLGGDEDATDAPAQPATPKRAAE